MIDRDRRARHHDVGRVEVRGVVAAEPERRAGPLEGLHRGGEGGRVLEVRDEDPGPLGGEPAGRLHAPGEEAESHHHRPLPAEVPGELHHFGFSGGAASCSVRSRSARMRSPGMEALSRFVIASTSSWSL